MKQSYLTKLSRAAHWKFSKEEADAILEDYRDIIGQTSRSEQELCRDLGTPGHVIRLIPRPKDYRQWLAVFLVAAVLLLFGAANPAVLWQMFRPLSAVLLTAGIGLSLFWFRRREARKGALPRSILPVLVLLLAGVGGVWWIACQVMFAPEAFAQAMERFGSRPCQLGPLVAGGLKGCGAIAALAGLFGLVQARVSDRRWRAVYVLSLTLAVLSASVLVVLSSMTLDTSALGWQQPYLRHYLLLTALGLAGTGVALC